MFKPLRFDATRLAAPLAALSMLFSANCQAQLSVDQAEGDGVLNATDTSWRYYVDQMKRFPERLGIICVNGYELDKTGDHVAGFAFLAECARRGNPPSMIYLAQMFEAGSGVPADPVQALAWLRRAAESGYAVAQFHLGVALLLGRGTAPDATAAQYWLRQAAAQGDDDAIALVRTEFSPALATTARPSYR